jgi:hypothetical protein
VPGQYLFNGPPKGIGGRIVDAMAADVVRYAGRALRVHGVDFNIKQ